MKFSVLYVLLIMAAFAATYCAQISGAANSPAGAAYAQGEESENGEAEGAGEGEEPGEEEAPPVKGEPKEAPIDLSIAPQPRQDMAGGDKEADAAYARVELLKRRSLPNWTYVYKVFDAEREFRGRLIVRKFEADDLRFGRLVVLEKEYMFSPQRVIRMAYRKENLEPVFMWMTYQFGDQEKKYTADYYYDSYFVRDEGDKVFYHNALPNPPKSFDNEQLIWIARQLDLSQLGGWRLITINVPTLEESFQVRVTREEDVEVKGADFKKYKCAHLVFDFGFVGDGGRIREHYFVELDEPNRLIQYAAANMVVLYESERQGSETDDFKPGQEVRELPKITPAGETETGAGGNGSGSEGEGEAPPPAEPQRVSGLDNHFSD